MQTDIEIVSSLLEAFFKEMNEWETEAYYILSQKEVDAEHMIQTFKITGVSLKIIYDKYLTDKIRLRTTRFNNISSKPNYNTETEKIVHSLQKTKNKIEIETFQNNEIELRHQYVFLKENDQWKLDNKKTLWPFKSRWESAII